MLKIVNEIKKELNIKKKKEIFNSVKIIPYIFVSPFIIAFLLFYLYPVISTINMSFQEILGPGDVKYIQFKNYINLFNHDFYDALIFNSWYTFWTLAVLIPLPVFLAVLLNSKLTIGKNFFRSSFFIPALTSVVVAGIFFRMFFGGMETTIPNTILKFFKIKPIVWTFKYHTAMMVLVIIATWRWLGVNIVYFLAGLQNISNDLYEAATIDGANFFQKFIYITLPGLKPVIIYVLTISIYAGYAMFAESYILYPNARTPGNIGLTSVLYLYQQGFDHNNLGFASAIGVTLLLIIFIINTIQLRFFGLFKKAGD
ncbi:MAG: sugar ABC transporter permease [Spirochaetes bacterium]|nr:sugar ABC transporter permease [Spirochaetota bacterium]